MRYLIGFLLFLPFFLQAQIEQDTIADQDIPEIEISDLNLIVDVFITAKPPLSISTYKATSIQDSKQQLSLQESLAEIPGLYALNANNYAQDLRVSIRGFGARAAFGIRGVKIIVDGIPETTPDGQGQIDNLNLGAIESIKVIRGPASAMYGNAAGGVIEINTLQFFEKNFVEAGLIFGGFTYGLLPDSSKLNGQGMQQYQIKAGVKNEKTRYIFQGNFTQSDGYRIQSDVKSFNINARAIHQFSSKASIKLQANYTNSPIANDAGGINLEATEDNRIQARDRNVLYQTGEEINQLKLGTTFIYDLKEKGIFRSQAFFSNRAFIGKLPFDFGGWIELNRNYMGQGSSYSLSKEVEKGIYSYHQIKVGYDLAYQRDERQRFINAEGGRGEETLNQIESFTNLAFYFQDKISIKNFDLHAALRYDWNELKATDLFLDNGDDSGKINLSALNPAIGLNYQFRNIWSTWVNYRSSFETPSLSELSSNPDNSIGFNENLKVQKANNFEFGISKTAVSKNRSLYFDAVYFHIDTKNELVPYELEAFPDRTFYRNAGATQRDGIEFSSTYYLKEPWNIAASYTYSQFVYKDYTLPNGSLEGNQLPGIPKHFASLSLNHQSKKGLIFSIQSRYSGDLFANDSNETVVEDFILVNTSWAYRFELKKTRITPFFGINNLLNTEYNDNIRINAFGNRFYEPAPELNYYGGVRVRVF